MNKLMLMGGAALLAISGASFAQTTVAEPAPDGVVAMPGAADAAAPSEAAPTATEATADSEALSSAPTAAVEATAAAAPVPATAGPAEATASADAAAKVNAEWAKYDEGNKGKLTALEFGSWVMAAKGQDMTAQVEKTKTGKKADLPAVKVLNATATDFAKADTDKDRMISPNELAIYLSA